MTFTIVWEHIVISLPLWIAPALRSRSCAGVYAGGLTHVSVDVKKPLFKNVYRLRRRISGNGTLLIIKILVATLRVTVNAATTTRKTSAAEH